MEIPDRLFGKFMIRKSSSAILAALVLAVGCGTKPPPPPPPDPSVGEKLLEPARPSGYALIAPRAADDSASILGQTAAIARARLREIRFTFDQCAGPRTNYVFSDATSLSGAAIGPSFTLKVLGGPTPAGTWIQVSEIPRLALDSEYVLFLRGTDWTFSPLVSDLALRVERVAGREILIHSSGRAVTGWGAQGPDLSEAVLTSAVGAQVRDYRTLQDRPDAVPESSTGGPNPQPSVTPPGEQPAPQPPPAIGAPIDHGPTDAQLRATGRFARPSLAPEAIANLQAPTVETFLGVVREAAARSNVRMEGRLALEPYWRCWAATNTASAAR